ncbi:unnamed protein product [Closterium sp. NIES-54]
MAESGFRTKESNIMPDVIVNSGGISIAFMIGSFQRSDSELWLKILKVGQMFRHSYGLCVCPSSQDSNDFARLYCQHNNQGVVKPPIIEVIDERSAVEKLLRMVHVLSEAKKQQTASLLNEERTEFVQSSEAIIAPLLTIPGLAPHEAQMVSYHEFSICSSKIAGATGIPLHKAEAVSSFFRDM